MTSTELTQAEERLKELGQFEETVVNFDDYSTDPIDYAALSQYFSRLACYCEYKMRAMQLRLAGDIDAAISFERGCDIQYRKLPSWAQW